MLEAGDFVLLADDAGFHIVRVRAGTPQLIDPSIAVAAEGEIRHGTPDGDPSAL